MNWRFSILDRNNVLTVIPEPTGWDANSCDITRDPDWHGIFFNSQGDEFEYEGKAMELIKAEKEQYGTEGNLTLIMEEDCGKGYEEFSRGRFDFSKYEYYCGDICYVKIPVENVSEVIDLRNRINQAVDLESLTAFDEVTALEPYDKLAFPILLPSKGIEFTNKAQLLVPADPLVLTLDDLKPVGLFPNLGWFQIVPQMEDTVYNEFGVMNNRPELEHEIICSGNHDTDGGPAPCADLYQLQKLSNATNRLILFDWTNATALLVNDNNTNNFDAISSFNLSYDYSMSMAIGNCTIVELNAVVLIKRKNGSVDVLKNTPIVQATFDSPTSWSPVDGTYWAQNTTHTISDSGAFTDVHLEKDEYLFVALLGLVLYSVITGNGTDPAYTLTSISGHVSMDTLSHTPATVAKVFAVNEAISRISESITNGRLRAYSDYFGRTDSQPYSTPQDGCGALEAITNGLRIRRQENKIQDEKSVFSVSLQQMFTGANPIHNIGIGVEPDPNRTGFNRMRVEPWHFFYNSSVILSCTGINQITHKTNEKEIYSTFSFGYGKWEAEEYNGLDEFLTKRGYRTTLSRVKNDFSQISTWIGSGYAWELTRRKGNTDSTDWRYDNDIFISCLQRGSTASFLIQFSASNSFNIAVWSGDYTFVDAFFAVGSTVVISSPMNSGTFHVTAISQVPGNLSVTVTEATVSELAIASVTNAQMLGIELGNIAFPKNIVDPDTVYNFRISPVRNAMRWMNKIFESYELFSTDDKIIFTDGEANYFASGEIANGGCKLENAPIQENVTIDSTIYSDTNECRPFMKAERVIYDYPMSSKEYKLVEANPYGLIYYENDCDEGLGWIDTISYKPEDGMATFTLIPAVNVDPTGCVPVAVRGDGTLPGGTVGVPYTAIINLYGTAPFVLSNIVKPSWMTVVVSGTTIYLSGTPTDVAVSTVSFDVGNCDAEYTASFNGNVTVIASAGCTAVTIPTTPVFPDAYTNTAYNYSFAIAGDAPFALANIVKPAWMNIAIVGTNIAISGTPGAAATGVTFSFDVTNCSGAQHVSVSGTIDITTYCVNVTLPDTISLPDAIVSTDYNYSLPIGGTAPFVLDSVVKPDWMSIDIVGSAILFSGTPAAVDTGVTVSFNITNCSSGTATLSDTIDVAVGGGTTALATSMLIGDGSATQFDLAHNFGTRNVIVSVRRNSTPWDEVIPDNECPDVNTVRVIFNVAPATDAYNVTIFAQE